MKSIILLCISLTFIITSCATSSFSNKGVGRVKKYSFYSPQLPEQFNGFQIAFVSDFHFESRFTPKRLQQLVHTLQATQADILLLGGDYKGRNGGDMTQLFNALEKVKTTYGTWAIMGNHERGKNYLEVRDAMLKTVIHLLEHRTDTIRKGNQSILICGIRNPFNLKENGISPTLSLSDEDFVILLTHTPDYVEDTDISHTDLALAGHTHGGQISLFKRWSPAHFSKYGNRFISGLKYNHQGIPVIISNGVGTSRKDIRLFTPSEIVLIKLYQKKQFSHQDSSSCSNCNLLFTK